MRFSFGTLRMFVRYLSGVFGFTAITFALACSSALAQQPTSQSKALANLARIACETGTPLQGNIDLDTGYMTMLGVGENSYAMQVLKNGRHTLMISAEQCRDLHSSEQKSFSFILSHYFKNRHQIREVYHYLVDQRGRLMNAVHFQEGRSRMYAFADPSVPLHRADFEAEKATWISKFAAWATAR